MKKFLIFLFLFLLCKLDALPIGDPTESMGFACNRSICYKAPYINARIGFYGDYVFNRKMRRHAANDFGGIHKTTISTNAVLMTLNLCQRFDLFGTLGGTHITMETFTQRSANNSFNKVYFETETGLSWSLGSKGVIYHKNQFFIGFESQYFAARPRINSLRQVRNPGITYRSNRLHYQEWQIGLALVYEFSNICQNIVPRGYFGVKYANAHFTNLENIATQPVPPLFTNAIFTLNTLKVERHWGLAFGSTLIAGKKASLNIELRFLDEIAFTINNQYRF